MSLYHTVLSLKEKVLDLKYKIFDIVESVKDLQKRVEVLEKNILTGVVKDEQQITFPIYPPGTIYGDPRTTYGDPPSLPKDPETIVVPYQGPPDYYYTKCSSQENATDTNLDK